MTVDATDRAAVRARAGNQCEYCLRSQINSPKAPLQIEHVVAKKHGGTDSLDNLALACIDCNLHKGTDLTGIDPESLHVTPLYHPRQQLWADHFNWQAVKIVGTTPIGRTTVRVLQLNSRKRLRVRTAFRGR